MTSPVAPAGSGTFVAVVGASGTGKDTILAGAREHLAQHPGILFPQRIITRKADRYEENLGVSEAEFALMDASGAFALSWQANGLRYALPVSVLDALAEGQNVVANISRLTVPKIRQICTRSLVVEIHVAPEVLARRLAGRARETAEEQRTRIDRSALASVGLAPDHRISNDGAPDEAIRNFLALLIPLQATKTSYPS